LDNKHVAPEGPAAACRRLSDIGCSGGRIVDGGGIKVKRWLIGIFLGAVGLVALYSYAMMNWSYSVGDRTGWIQKFSRKGWICKTWEGEMAMVSMPATVPEKFTFTVWDPKVVEQIEASMGRRVTLKYEQKKGLPTSCFGDTEYWIIGVTASTDIPMIPGTTVPAPQAAPAPAPDAQPSTTAPPSTTTAPPSTQAQPAPAR
jgi:hypothetical protein